MKDLMTETERRLYAEVEDLKFKLSIARGLKPQMVNVLDRPGLTIPKWVAEKAYEGYCKKYGQLQSLDDIISRGGFGSNELDEFVPEWKKMSDDFLRVWHERDELREEVKACRQRENRWIDAFKTIFAIWDNSTSNDEIIASVRKFRDNWTEFTTKGDANATGIV